VKLPLVLSFGVLLAVGCGAPSRGDDDGDDDVPEMCTPGQNTCAGDEVRACNADGTVGDLVEACDGAETCANGACVVGGNCGAQGVELIYVVDTSNNFYSFDPAGDAHTFTQIGTLSCPNVGVGLGDGAPATPFSMSVDRTGVAWVLFSSGKIFKVSTQDASCTESTWQVGAGGFELFGMGFVLDVAGGDSEHLFVAGGTVLDFENSNLGSIDPTTLAVTRIAPMSGPPELTGAGTGDLYAFMPQFLEAARIDKATGVPSQTWDVSAAVTGFPGAYAVAHWGGQLFIFTGDGEGQGQVGRLDLTTGVADLVVPSNGMTIVGAGVSTCAPVNIP
jgi:hypothetical protein